MGMLHVDITATSRGWVVDRVMTAACALCSLHPRERRQVREAVAEALGGLARCDLTAVEIRVVDGALEVDFLIADPRGRTTSILYMPA